eukprot:10565588-Lingulodinium_polyedra.AAC.1
MQTRIETVSNTIQTQRVYTSNEKCAKRVRSLARAFGPLEMRGGFEAVSKRVPGSFVRERGCNRARIRTRRGRVRVRLRMRA